MKLKLHKKISACNTTKNMQQSYTSSVKGRPEVQYKYSLEREAHLYKNISYALSM